MTATQRTRTVQALLVATLFAVLPPEFAAAQGGPGFLFRQPIVSVGLRTGYSLPRAGSDIFSHTQEQLTHVVGRDGHAREIENSDFAGNYFGGEVSVRVSDHVDLAFGVGYTESITRSEFRDWVDTDDQAIEQTTKFAMTPVTLSAKYFLMDRGRSIGRFAWVPARLNAYVGGGVGVTFYNFDQVGDWVDFETSDIFNTQFKSNGNGKQLHALAGIDLTITKNIFLTGESRYLWADAALDETFFKGFNDVDLAGLQFSVGISARF